MAKIIVIYNGNIEQFETGSSAAYRITCLLGDGLSANAIEVYKAEPVGISVRGVELYCDGTRIDNDN